jgi:ribosomal protein S18 acetylase RimI-like enzyme
LWVSELERGRIVGSQIILAAESEAIKRGCIGSTLDTFSFQALGFYEKLGYSLVGKLSGYLGEHERFYLQKKLG